MSLALRCTTFWILALAFSGCDKERRPDKLVVPSGFSGWVTVHYLVTGAPSLPIEQGKNVIRVDGHGEISTSSNYEAGSAKDEYYFDDGHSLTLIPEEGQGNGTHAWRAYRESQGGRVFDRFFIGTTQEYAAASKKAPIR